MVTHQPDGTAPRGRAVMVLGCTSGAGKSWIATALCRWAARQGLRVAPFKAQNMSNNARVVPTADGHWGEIGSAQYFQALAAGVAPAVQHNPLLLKPEADTRSQVVWMGQVDPALSALPWAQRAQPMRDLIWPQMRDTLQSLRAQHDLVVIEGAGSPAEINLMDTDFVNLRVARAAQARCILAVDIDRGGAFAHLYGTWALIPEADRALLAGFVLNRFRGDASLLHPGPEQLQQLTGVPTLAVLPMLRGHGLPEEDGAWLDAPAPVGAAGRSVPTVVVLAYPRISNLDEFTLLAQHSGCRMRWARCAADCVGADWLVLPGSKHSLADLAWMRQHGLDAAVAQHAEAGRPVLGICGGLQMLGEAIVDPDGLEGGSGDAADAPHLHDAPGLGLLMLVTRFTAPKTVRPCNGVFGAVPTGPFAGLQGVAAHGYEIHLGQTVPHADAAVADAALPVLWGQAGQPLGWCHPKGHVMGLYAHGLLEDPQLLHALWPTRAGVASAGYEQVFDRLADHLNAHFTPGSLQALCGLD